MGTETDVESTTLAQRIVLCSAVALAEAGTTPMHSGELRAVANERLERADGIHVSEADVMRALNALVETELISEVDTEESSPVGKGRPRYELAVDADELAGALAEDERIASLLD